MTIRRGVLAFAAVLLLAEPAAAALALCHPHRTSRGSAGAMAAYARHDYHTAYVKFRALSENGNAAAQNQLGVMYNRGKGVPQDYIVAVRWWRRSAHLGNATAQCNLGIMYSYGQGVKQNEVLAHMWFNLAAARGSREARKRRDNLATWRMTRGQVLEAQRLAAEFDAHH